MKKKLIIDIRGLNYPYLTGINTATLHALFQINQVKLARKNLEVVGVGLRKSRLNKLNEEFGWFEDFFDEYQSIGEYLGLPKTLWADWAIKPINIVLDLTYSFSSILQEMFGKYAKQADVVWLPQPKAWIWDKSARVVVTVHDLFAVMDGLSLGVGQKIRENRWLYGRLFRDCDLILAPSYSTSSDIVRFFGDKLTSKIRWVRFAKPEWGRLINPNKQLQLEDKSAEKSLVKLVTNDLPRLRPYILALSGIEPRKNWINLILGHARARILFPEYRSIKLVLAGHPVNHLYLEQIQKLIKECEIGEVKLILSPSELSKQELLQHCLFVAYPSLYEGFGLPILEAFVHKKSVLTSQVSSMPELAKDSGIYINPHDVEDIARGLYILSIDGEFRNRLESKIQINSADYDWNEVYKFWDKII